MLIEQLTPSTDLNSIASDYGVEIKTAEGLMYNNINISVGWLDRIFIL